ncbi:hypothetical protein [Phascolarctobacterium sp.]|uniref:hypothetical protein n=1 Tax=Phascolarctobacterium sp. TaxID=2049039 RepID=UPI00386FCB65
MEKKTNKICEVTEDNRILVSSAQLSRMLEISDTTIAVWVKNGCPKERRGWFDVAAVIKWRNQPGASENVTEGDKLEADVKLKRARLELAQIEIQVKNGQLVPMETVKDYLENTFTTLKTSMLAIGDHLMTETFTQFPELAPQIKRLTDGYIREALRELAESRGRIRPAETSKPRKTAGRPRKANKR